MIRFKNLLLTTFAAIGCMAFAMSAAQAGDFKITSPDVKEGQSISMDHVWDTFGCTGKNIRPELNWSGAPEGTKSFAITVYDPDAPTGSGVWHYSLYNIPANVTSLKSNSIPAGSVEGNTDAGKPGYFGPCPPKGFKNRYVFTVYALKVADLGIKGQNLTAPFTGFYINMNTIAKAKLTATFGPR